MGHFLVVDFFISFTLVVMTESFSTVQKQRAEAEKCLDFVFFGQIFADLGVLSHDKAFSVRESRVDISHNLSSLINAVSSSRC